MAGRGKYGEGEGGYGEKMGDHGRVTSFLHPPYTTITEQRGSVRGLASAELGYQPPSAFLPRNEGDERTEEVQIMVVSKGFE